MRRVSLKRRKLLSEALPWREAYKLEIGKCECCGKRRGLIVHEIARGTADRKKAMATRFATLVLCDPGCHQTVGSWSRAKQLCLLYVRRPYDFDLPKYHALIARVHPELGEVLDWIDTLLEEIA